MENLIVFIHVLAALSVTGLVLIQHGKGADMGASFGSGASQTIFGSVGSGNALTKSTTWLATVFFITSLVLALFAKQQAAQSIQDSFLIENPEQLVQPASEPSTPATSDLPVLPAVESQIPAEQQIQDAAAESASTTIEPPVQEQVEETAEDLQNATQN
jgi:preprotein translocase subunit SecG